MTVVFLTNFMTHHQTDFCNYMYEALNGDFHLVVMRPTELEQKNLGYRDLNYAYPYVTRVYESKESDEKALRLCREADVVIIGSASKKYIDERQRTGKMTFIYTERIFKKDFLRAFSPRMIKSILLKYTKYRNYEQYYLCASAYTSHDINIYTHTPKKFFKWGYFPPFQEINDLSRVIFERRENPVPQILWVGRFISWKHSEYAITLAEALRQKGYKFKLKLIGNGELLDNSKETLSAELNGFVEFCGAMPPEQVRKEMLRSDIFISTSDFNEGWGAVINEAMNSACAVVASHAMGSVPFLIDSNKNGLIFKSGDVDDLISNVIRLLDDRDLREAFGKAAYMTIADEWNADVATKRLLELMRAILLKQDISFEKGPCSIAPILKNNWYRGGI